MDYSSHDLLIKNAKVLNDFSKPLSDIKKRLIDLITPDMDKSILKY